MTTETRRIEYWLDKPEEYWVCFASDDFIKVEGRPIRLDGMGEADLFVCHLEGYGWRVVEGTTGCGFSQIDGKKGVPCVEEAIEAAKAHISADNLIDRQIFAAYKKALVQRYGLSPRYRLEEYDD